MRYKVNTPPTNIPEERDARLSLFKKKNDKNLFNMIDSENIKLSGSKIKVYKYIKSNDVDDIYMESRQKTISPEPVIVWGHFDPRPIEENLSQFGVEVQYDQVFNFNKSYVENLLGSPIEIGDVLEPEFQDIKFEVYEVQEDSFELYGVYHMACSAKLLRDDKSTLNEPLLERSNDLGGYLDIES